MQGRVKVVLLGGTLGQSRLQSALRRPVLCLPIGGRGTLATQWLDALSCEEAVRHVTAVLNTDADAQAVLQSVAVNESRAETRRRLGEQWFQAIGERESWRGPAGIVRDVTTDVPSEEFVLVAEGHAVPPASVAAMLERIVRGDVVGAVGLCGNDAPAGVFAFIRSSLELVPGVGYFDLKEQLLPALHKAGGRVASVRVDGTALRVRDRESYLRAVAASLTASSTDSTVNRVSAAAEVSDDAIIDGGSIVCGEAVVESCAVIHQSVILEGARIGRDAVVSRCVIGEGVLVESGTRLVDQVVSAATGVESQRREALLRRSRKRSNTLRESA